MRDLEFERFMCCYESAPPTIKLLVIFALWTVAMTRSSLFFVTSALSIVALMLLASLINTPPLFLVAGMGIGGIVILMLVVLVLRVLLSTDSE